jgi:hypothetical protein
MSASEPSRETIEQLGVLSPQALEAMYDAAAQSVVALESMTRRGLNPVTEALAGVREVEEWAHYPDGDARDHAARARYYYHLHSVDERYEMEHGHFHVFLDWPASNNDIAPTHVVGVAMSAEGQILRLFTTNGWVTGETWRAAESVSDSLQSFNVSSDPARRDLDLWIGSIVRLFQPQIRELLRRRDAALLEMRARHPESDVLEDRSVRVLSETRVDLLAQIRAIENALAHVAADPKCDRKR